jgi:hypothetical protein
MDTEAPPPTPRWVWILLGGGIVAAAVLLTVHLLSGGMVGHH